MFGMEILDVVIGLIFVYLLLSLFATAVNEYIAAVLNLRGKELARGLGRLLDDLDNKQSLTKARAAMAEEVDEAAARARKAAMTLTEKLYNHQLIKPLRSQGMFTGRTRLPSYIPARSFAPALLDQLGYKDHSATAPEQTEADEPETAAEKRVKGVVELLKKESPADVREQIGDLKERLADSALPPEFRLGLLNSATAAQTKLQNLHDSVEVWFNNAMDRVSGSYKRKTQIILFLIGLVTAVMLNADTIQMWRQLAENDELATAMANRAAATAEALDDARRNEDVPADTTAADSNQVTASAPGREDTATAAADTTNDSLPAPNPNPGQRQGTTTGSDTTTTDTSAVARAERVYQIALARLDSMELKLGWTRGEAVRIGVAHPWREGGTKPLARGEELKKVRPDFWPFNDKFGPFMLKVFGLLLTAIAISLGAPFWFDLLNKVISIRAAGRSPQERPKSPDGQPKRLAEQENR